jgi:hypothetical protein
MPPPPDLAEMTDVIQRFAQERLKPFSGDRDRDHTYPA